MPDQVIYKAAELMKEQSAAYDRLCRLFSDLIDALIRGDLYKIDSLTRAGQGEMLRLRSRLAQTTSILSKFASTRRSAPEKTTVSAEARQAFESASDDLVARARYFQRLRARAAALALNGVAFASACIEMYGIRPTTYSPPYLRQGVYGRWR